MHLGITYHHQNCKRNNKKFKLHDLFYEHYCVLVVGLRKTKVVITVRNIIVNLYKYYCKAVYRKIETGFPNWRQTVMC